MLANETGVSERGEHLTEVKEELHQDVDSEMSVWLEVFEIEAPDDEKNSESDESHHLHWLPAKGIDGRD